MPKQFFNPDLVPWFTCSRQPTSKPTGRKCDSSEVKPVTFRQTRRPFLTLSPTEEPRIARKHSSRIREVPEPFLHHEKVYPKQTSVNPAIFGQTRRLTAPSWARSLPHLSRLFLPPLLWRMVVFTKTTTPERQQETSEIYIKLFQFYFPTLFAPAIFPSSPHCCGGTVRSPVHNPSPALHARRTGLLLKLASLPTHLISPRDPSNPSRLAYPKTLTPSCQPFLTPKIIIISPLPLRDKIITSPQNYLNQILTTENLFLNILPKTFFPPSAHLSNNLVSTEPFINQREDDSSPDTPLILISLAPRLITPSTPNHTPPILPAKPRPHPSSSALGKEYPSDDKTIQVGRTTASRTSLYPRTRRLIIQRGNTPPRIDIISQNHNDTSSETNINNDNKPTNDNKNAVDNKIANYKMYIRPAHPPLSNTLYPDSNISHDYAPAQTTPKCRIRLCKCRMKIPRLQARSQVPAQKTEEREGVKPASNK